MASISYQSREVVRQVNIAHEASATVDGEDLDPEWVNSIRDKLKKEPRKIKSSPSSCSIHRIPPTLRHLDKKAYKPQIISIGPFHYAKRRDDLRAMEEHKWRYVSSLFLRNEKGGKNEKDYLELCLQVVKKMEREARECYSEEFNLDSKSFVEMMVLDGCFLIELFVRVSKQHEHDDDPILNMVLRPTITTDLIMLENQIPFFILQLLFHLVHIPGPSLEEMALKFLRWRGSVKGMMTNSSIDHSNLNCHHLLHFLHLKCLPSLENEGSRPDNSGMIPCASELQEAGIKFKKQDAVSGFLHIKYCEEKIEIPPIRITRNSETIFLNLVAFEQFYPHEKPYITAYIIFMDRLINSVNDVKILSKVGIIVEKYGSSDDVATLFNKIGRELWVNSDKNYLKNTCRRIHQSTEKVWPRLRATLVHDYFNSPWAFISFLAAVVLLVFTFFQTFFSAFPKFAFEN